MKTAKGSNPVWILIVVCFASLPTFSQTVRSQEQSSDPPVAGIISQQRDEVDQTIDRAIGYLISQQQESGAFGDRSHLTAMTSLGIMALASVGTTPQEDNARGRSMKKALDFVLAEERQDKDGYFGGNDGSRMYGHGIITLMLSEMLGMGSDEAQDEKIHDACQRGIELILRSQRQRKPTMYQGGWRYTPDAADADLSVSVWQVMALRSAKTDGIDVPDEAISQAIEYFERSCTSPLDAAGNPIREAAGFAYTPGSDQIKFTMTAAGLLAMQVCGQYESPLVDKAADWLLANPPSWEERFFFYGTYYYAQGMYQKGGSHYEAARDRVRQILLEKQKPDGSWEGHGEEAGAGPVYTTSLAILSLGVKYHYLPIYQK